MFQWRPAKDDRSPNYDALPAREGDNCVLTTDPSKPVVATTLGELVDVAQSYEYLGDEYYSEPNYRWPKERMVHVPAIELVFRGGKIADTHDGERFYDGCHASRLYVTAMVAGLPNGGSAEVLRVFPEANEFGERFFTPAYLKAFSTLLAENELVSKADSLAIEDRFVRKCLDLAASQIVMRYEEYIKETRLSSLSSIKTLLDFERMISFRPPEDDEQGMDEQLEEYRRALLEQPFVKVYGEMGQYTSPEQVLAIFRRLASGGDYDELEQNELSLLSYMSEERIVPKISAHPRITLDMARFCRQFGTWFAELAAS